MIFANNVVAAKIRNREPATVAITEFPETSALLIILEMLREASTPIRVESVSTIRSSPPEEPAASEVILRTRTSIGARDIREKYAALEARVIQ